PTSCRSGSVPLSDETKFQHPGYGRGGPLPLSHGSAVTRPGERIFFLQKGKHESMSEECEETPREAGGVPLADISLSLRTNVEALFGMIETIGAGARGAAREHL